MNLARIVREPAVSVAFFGICAALLGFVREQVIATRLGLSISTDAFYLALTVCTFLPALVNGAGLGILGAYHARTVKDHGETAGKQQLSQLLLVSTSLGVAAIGLLIVGEAFVYPFLAHSRNVDKLHLMMALSLVVSLGIPALCLAPAAVASLNLLNRYALAGASTIVAPLTAAVTLYYGPASPWTAAIGLTLGLNLQSALLLWGLRRHGVVLWCRPDRAVVRKALKDMGYLGVGAFVANVPGFVIQSIVATHGARSTSTYMFGIKITTASIGLSALFFSTLLNPIFAARAAGLPFSAKRMKVYLWMALVLNLGFVALMMCESTSVIRLFLRRGAFSESDVALVAGIHVFAMLQLPCYLFSFLMLRMVAAYQDARFMSRMSWVQMATTLSLAWPLHAALGIRGLLLANALSYAITGVCYYLRYRYLHQRANTVSLTTDVASCAA